jgi:hypothetical protein
MSRIGSHRRADGIPPDVILRRETERGKDEDFLKRRCTPYSYAPTLLLVVPGSKQARLVDPVASPSLRDTGR